MSIYAPCHCNSGKKLKFCCYELSRSGSEIKKLQAFVQFPLEICVKGVCMYENGLETVLIVRKISDDHYAVGMYLLDVWCLGLKDAEFSRNVSLKSVQDLIVNTHKSYGRLENISYEDARGQILGAIDYARALDFEPHPDWSYAQYFVEPHRPYTTDFVFGHNGKPLYIEGPYDKNVNRIRAKIAKAGGHWTTGM